jgi:cytochrome c oxidase assembly factor 6
MSFPSKSEREKCWTSRDEFWKCMDENQLQKEDPKSVCGKFRAVYESSCPSQWV